MQAHIPFEEIDCEIRKLVDLVNRIPGITTLSSCAGHAPDLQTIIVFSAETQSCLHQMLSRLPFVGAQARLVGERPIFESICVTARPGARRPVYELRVNGAPAFAQRALIEAIEASIKQPAPSRRPPYSSGAQNCSGGTIPVGQ